MPQYGQRATLSPGNQWRFNCPVFHVEVGIAACLNRRDEVWRGRAIPDKGCTVALRASKCPIPHVINDMMRNESDPYHSTEPVVGRLDSSILERIAPVLVPEKAIEQGGLSIEDHEALTACNAAARDGIRPAAQPKATRKLKAAPKPTQRQESSAPEQAESQALPAQQDMAALVNTMAAEERSKSSTLVQPGLPATPTQLAVDHHPPEVQLPTGTVPLDVVQVRAQPAPPASTKPGMSLLELARRAKEAKA